MNLAELKMSASIWDRYKGNNSRYSYEKVRSVACSVFNCNVNDFNTVKRKREVVYARMIVAGYLRYSCFYSLTKIGDLLCRDHATILHYLRQLKNHRDTRDKLFVESINEFRKRLIDTGDVRSLKIYSDEKITLSMLRK